MQYQGGADFTFGQSKRPLEDDTPVSEEKVAKKLRMDDDTEETPGKKRKHEKEKKKKKKMKVEEE